MAASAGRHVAVRALGFLFGLLALQGLGGCASSPPTPIPPGTLMIGEVMKVLTSEIVAAGTIEPGAPQAQLRRQLEARGLTDDDVRRGRVFVVRTLIYWNNTISGITRDELSPEAAAEGLDVQPGNVVEMRLGPHGAMITGVRAPDLAAGGCFYADVGVGMAVETLGALSMVGPRGSASLYCPGLEHEGWVRPRTYWHKPPGPAQPAPKDFVPPRPVQTAAAPEPAPSLAEQGLARVTIYLPRAKHIFLRDLPVYVDGEPVGSLQGGYCTVVLLPDGAHTVIAGREDATLIDYARKVLEVQVRAGEALVLEYLVNDSVLDESLTPFLNRDAWAERAYKFRQRAGAFDCKMREPARVVGRRTLPGVAK